MAAHHSDPDRLRWRERDNPPRLVGVGALPAAAYGQVPDDVTYVIRAAVHRPTAARVYDAVIFRYGEIPAQVGVYRRLPDAWQACEDHWRDIGRHWRKHGSCAENEMARAEFSAFAAALPRGRTAGQRADGTR